MKQQFLTAIYGFAALTAVVTVPATSADAATVTHTTQINTAFSVSSTDLLQTNLLSTASTGSFIKVGGAQPISALTNGIFGRAWNDYGNGVFADGTNSVTYTLDAAYDLTSIATFSGWDLFRGGQSYTVSYATAAEPTSFVTLASVYNNAFGGGNVSTRAIITPDSGFLASNVVAVKFNFNSDLTAGYAAYREIDVFGTAAVSAAVPEPATWAMLIAGFGLVGTAARRRRTRVAGC